MKKIFLYFFFLTLILFSCSPKNCKDPESGEVRIIKEEFPLGCEITFKVNGQRGTVVDYDLCDSEGIKIRISLITYYGSSQTYYALPHEIEPALFEIIPLE